MASPSSSVATSQEVVLCLDSDTMERLIAGVADHLRNSGENQGGSSSSTATLGVSSTLTVVTGIYIGDYNISYSSLRATSISCSPVLCGHTLYGQALVPLFIKLVGVGVGFQTGKRTHAAGAAHCEAHPRVT